MDLPACGWCFVPIVYKSKSNISKGDIIASIWSPVVIHDMHCGYTVVLIILTIEVIF